MTTLKMTYLASFHFAFCTQNNVLLAVETRKPAPQKCKYGSLAYIAACTAPLYAANDALK